MERKPSVTKSCRKEIIVLTFAMFLGFSAVPECEDNVMVKLPHPRLTSSTSVEKALSERRSVRSFTIQPLSIEDVSQICWSAQGTTNERGYRTAPSGGALYPLELYIAVGNVAGLSEGLYRYEPMRHSIVMIKKGNVIPALCKASYNQSCIRESSIVLVFSSVWERITKKYGERGRRYALIEAGHASQNVYLQAETLGLGTVAVGAFLDDEVKKIVGLQNGEDPLYMMPVGKK
ncbi:SagB/ThcOx family dehydrogenase [Candidatus Latescibacterota bacterium]